MRWFTGLPVQIDKIEEIAKGCDIPIIEDAARHLARLLTQKSVALSAISRGNLNPVKKYLAR